MKNKISKSELKEKSDLLKEYMSMIPVGYTFENETTKKVFAVLYYYYVHNGKTPFTIGIRTIAEEAIVPRMTTNRNINLLIDKYNYIECEKGHRNVNSTYNILPCPTECPNQCPTLIKNDMGQQELVGQQNGTAKMIHNGTRNIIDNEIVTDVELDEVGQSQCDNGDFDDLGHKYKLKYKHKHNNLTCNITLITMINKIINFLKEKENKEKVDITLNFQEDLLVVLSAVVDKFENLETRIRQLEENKKEVKGHLNSHHSNLKEDNDKDATGIPLPQGLSDLEKNFDNKEIFEKKFDLTPTTKLQEKTVTVTRAEQAPTSLEEDKTSSPLPPSPLTDLVDQFKSIKDNVHSETFEVDLTGKIRQIVDYKPQTLDESLLRDQTIKKYSEYCGSYRVPEHRTLTLYYFKDLCDLRTEIRKLWAKGEKEKAVSLKPQYEQLLESYRKEPRYILEASGLQRYFEKGKDDLIEFLNFNKA